MGKQFNGTVTWVGHSTFLVETPGGKRILIEGFVDNCPTTPDSLKGDGLGHLDAILITHGHQDHMADTAAHQRRTGCKVLCGFELSQWFEDHGIPADHIIGFGKGGTMELDGGISVTMWHAFHSASTPDHAYAGEPASYIIELEDGYTIHHAGDTCLYGDMKLMGEIWNIDLALLPIGGFYTMGPKLAAKACELIGCTDMIGMHWGTWPPLAGRPSEVAALVGDGCTVHELQPGESFGRVPATA